MVARDIARTLEALWRIEAPRLIARLARITGDVAAAEDLAQDALVVALERWPREGTPANPAAWLVTTATRRAIDDRRHRLVGERVTEVLAREVREREHAAPDLAAALDDPVGDELLGLVFALCHPLLAREARVALTLRLLGGLTTGEIARAFLTPEPTMAQRIARAKRTLAVARVPIEVPAATELPERVASVQEVVYLIFTEGYAASAGDDWVRPELCRDAMRLGRMLARLMDGDGETHGLVALMELQASRLAARVARDGAPVLLEDQDRTRWDHLLIRRGLAALGRAEALGPLGPYGLQAAIAACHARAPRAAATDWPRIAALYDALAQALPSPVIELNRAVALGMAFGPEVGLALTDALAQAAVMDAHHRFWAVRGELLRRAGRAAEARECLTRAAALAPSDRERTQLVDRAADIGAEAGQR